MAWKTTKLLKIIQDLGKFTAAVFLGETTGEYFNLATVRSQEPCYHLPEQKDYHS